MTTDQPRPRDGDLAIVRYTHGDGLQIAQYRDRGDLPCWAYFGTNWTDSPSQVTVVRRVQLAEVTA